MIILIDNGHGKATKGKCSPDKSFYEYKWNREIAKRISNRLNEIGIENHLLVPEVEGDISLTERANRANKYCQLYGKSNCLFLSIHSNAAGNGGKWMTAQGWSCFTSKGLTKSDEYAEIFMDEALKILAPLGRKVRKYSQKKYSWEEDFTVLKKTWCPAVLTESMFYDNHSDLEFIKSEEGKQAIVDIHINAILRIIQNKAL